MGNKPGSLIGKYRRDCAIVMAYDEGEDTEQLAGTYQLTERRIYQIVSEENRRIMQEWASEASSNFSQLGRAV
jgi:Mor family transcriptional regulator